MHLRKQEFYPPASRIVSDGDAFIVEVRPTQRRFAKLLFSIALAESREVFLYRLPVHFRSIGFWENHGQDKRRFSVRKLSALCGY